jgi:hypothetical protein
MQAYPEGESVAIGHNCCAIDQAHEQNNAIVKGDGGAIGLTEDPAALRRWMVAGPKISRLFLRS